MEPLRSPRNLRAKRSTDNSYMPMALTADRWTNGRAVTLVPDAYATRIVTGRGALEQSGATTAAAAFSAALSDSGVATNGVGRAVGRNLKAALAHVDRLLGVLVLTDDDVEAQNRVSLSAFPPDENGAIPRVEVHHRQRSPRTAANREFLVAKARELITAAGAVAVLRTNWPPVLVHMHSSLRMGANAADSVLDEHAEARAVRRLFVADNSALPNSLGGANPTLTTQALATRTAERIVTRYFDGKPWVGKDSPLSSIDPAVTLAVAALG